MDAGLVTSVVAGILMAWAAFVLLLWLLRPRGAGAAELLRVVPDIVRLCRDLLVDRSVPLDARLAIGGLLVWLVNPIDLVPEFIPVVGPLDDVVVAVLVLRYLRRRLGEDRLRARWRGSAQGFDLLRAVTGPGTARPRPGSGT